MTHTPLLSHLRRTLRLATLVQSTNQRYENIVERGSNGRLTRRDVIAAGMGGMLAASRAFAARPAPNVDVGIVGAGLAGLACG